MQYMLLITAEEGVRDSWSEEEQQADMQRWFAYHTELQESGAFVAGNALQPSATATTVRVRDDGELLTTDGPFAETKEIINGYYLVDVDDLDQAIEWAAKIPTPGAVEVRPVLDMSELTSGFE